MKFDLCRGVWLLGYEGNLLPNLTLETTHVLMLNEHFFFHFLIENPLMHQELKHARLYSFFTNNWNSWIGKEVHCKTLFSNKNKFLIKAQHAVSSLLKKKVLIAVCFWGNSYSGPIPFANWIVYNPKFKYLMFRFWIHTHWKILKSLNLRKILDPWQKSQICEI